MKILVTGASGFIGNVGRYGNLGSSIALLENIHSKGNFDTLSPFLNHLEQT